jgi:hypothetical protein
VCCWFVALCVTLNSIISTESVAMEIQQCVLFSIVVDLQNVSHC